MCFGLTVDGSELPQRSACTALSRCRSSWHFPGRTHRRLPLECWVDLSSPEVTAAGPAAAGSLLCWLLHKVREGLEAVAICLCLVLALGSARGLRFPSWSRLEAALTPRCRGLAPSPSPRFPHRLFLGGAVCPRSLHGRVELTYCLSEDRGNHHSEEGVAGLLVLSKISPP